MDAHAASSPSRQASASMAPAQHSGADASSQYLTFRLGSEEYAIEILSVQEIRNFEEPTRMVNSPPFIKGVVNLRGVIVPIVDLRLKLGIDSAAYDDFTVVIVLNVHGTVVGVVVDSVADVVTLEENSIMPAPQFDSGMDNRFIRGLVRMGERTLIVSKISELLSPAELGMVA